MRKKKTVKSASWIKYMDFIEFLLSNVIMQMIVYVIDIAIYSKSKSWNIQKHLEKAPY